MPSLHHLSSASRSRKRIRVWIAILLGVPVILYCVAFALTYTDRFETIPSEVWATRDARLLWDASRQRDRSRAATHEEFRHLIEVTDDAVLPPASEAVMLAADQWVQELNRHNPQAILYHEVDSFGHLYVVFGGWWALLSSQEQLLALDGLGVAWRSFLQSHFGSWDGREGFAPGIIVVDETGEVARNLNGQIILHRR